MADHTTYELLKDFAGPAAAIIGAIVAGTIAFVFGRAQKNIAGSQRDIALDKLKFDLIDRRYAIYEAAKQLLEYLTNIHDLEHTDSAKVRSLYVLIDEARFYFPPDIIELLSDIRLSCERFFLHLGRRQNLSVDDSEQWAATADSLAQTQGQVRSFYAALPAKFESALSFKQLKSVQ